MLNNNFYKLKYLLITIFIALQFNYIYAIGASSNFTSHNCNVNLKNLKVNGSYNRKCIKNVKYIKIANQKQELKASAHTNTDNINTFNIKHKDSLKKILKKSTNQDKDLQDINQDLKQLEISLK